MNQGAKIATFATILKVMHMKLQGLLFFSTHLRVHCLPHLASVLGICLLNPKTCPVSAVAGLGRSHFPSTRVMNHNSGEGRYHLFKLVPLLR